MLVSEREAAAPIAAKHSKARAATTGERTGHEPTGKPFVVDHIHIYRLEGDGIDER